MWNHRAKGTHGDGSYYYNTASQPLGDGWKTSYLRGDSVRRSNDFTTVSDSVRPALAG
jgi:hypothetical protein